MLEFLLLAVPAGFVLDVVGFILLISYGHNLFIWFGENPPKPGEGNDTILHLEGPGLDSGQHRRLRQRALMGAWAVVIGFALQLIGSIAVLLVEWELWGSPPY